MLATDSSIWAVLAEMQSVFVFELELKRCVELAMPLTRSTAFALSDWSALDLLILHIYIIYAIELPFLPFAYSNYHNAQYNLDRSAPV